MAGGWKGIIFEIIESTNRGYPVSNSHCTRIASAIGINSFFACILQYQLKGLEILCLVDKKAFKAEYRNAITSYLDELEVQWTFKLANDLVKQTGNRKSSNS